MTVDPAFCGEQSLLTQMSFRLFEVRGLWWILEKMAQVNVIKPIRSVWWLYKQRKLWQVYPDLKHFIWDWNDIGSLSPSLDTTQWSKKQKLPCPPIVVPPIVMVVFKWYR